MIKQEKKHTHELIRRTMLPDFSLGSLQEHRVANLRESMISTSKHHATLLLVDQYNDPKGTPSRRAYSLRSWSRTVVPTSPTLSLLCFSFSSFVLCLLWPASGTFQSETSYALSEHQQASLTTSSARLCYHLPRVYQLDTLSLIHI